MPAFSVSGVIFEGLRPLGAASAIESDSTLPLFLSSSVTNPLPPMSAPGIAALRESRETLKRMWVEHLLNEPTT